jgi:small subunit ribosomal protein S6
MRSYESMIAYHPDAGEAGIKDLLDRAKQVIGGAGGEVSQIVEWGQRDLAYRIEKQRRGSYYVIEFKGTGATVAELERNLRISDRVLRYITVQVDPNRPPLEPPRARRDAQPGEGEGGAEASAPASEDARGDDARDTESPEMA